MKISVPVHVLVCKSMQVLHQCQICKKSNGHAEWKHPTTTTEESVQPEICDIYIQKTQVNKVCFYLSMSDKQRT